MKNLLTICHFLFHTTVPSHVCPFLIHIGNVLSESISSQHSTRFGGVIPTFAMYFHADRIEHVVADTLLKEGSVVFTSRRVQKKRWSGSVTAVIVDMNERKCCH